MIRLVSSFFIVGLSLFYFSCNSDHKSGNFYEEINGLISIEVENYDSCMHWKQRSYYTGEGIAPDLSEKLAENFVEYPILFDTKGAYYFHYLGNRSREADPEKTAFKVYVIDKDGNQVDSSACAFPATNAPYWSSIDVNHEHERVSLSIPSRGLFTLQITAAQPHRFYLDKLVLTLDNQYLPSGTGPMETWSVKNDSIYRDEIVLPPRWAFGVLYGGYTDHWQTIEVIDSLINGDFPIDAYWIDSYFWDFNKGEGPGGYIDFVGDTMAFPDVKKLWDEFEARKIKAGIWIWNIIQQEGNEAVYKDFKEKGFFSNLYLNKNGWHNETQNTMTGSVDFENPEAVKYWQQQLKPFFDRGLDFLKLDNSSAIPFSKAAFEATQEMGLETKGRGFILAHLHTTYDNRHKLYPTKWTGDAKIAWTQPDYPNMWVYAMGALKENIGMVADPSRSTYEIPFLSHDAGGYNYFGSTDQSEELYTRWIQFSAMNTIMMFFSTAENPTRNHPYRYSEEVQENFKKYTHLRMKLFPYIYSYALETHLTGTKLIRGMHGEGYQYLFGNEMLIAPVFEKGAQEKSIRLPEGRWIDPETGIIYDGGSDILMDAPLNKLPLLIRMGSIIPMRKYARSVELGTNDTLYLEVYPIEEETYFDLKEDDGISNDYLSGKYARTRFTVSAIKDAVIFEIEPVEGNYEGMKAERFYHLNFHQVPSPSVVKANGEVLSQWSYSQEDMQLHVMLSLENKTGVKIEIQK